MRPQIRSIPLSEIECPQFSWAIRNNSTNISAILQPDLHHQKTEGEIYTGKLKNFNKCPKQGVTCNCDDKILKPTLFSHPATCVCSDDPCLPRDGVYKHYKLKMEDKAIGDLMEEIIMRKMPSPPTSPICKETKWYKKTMRSSHSPERLRLEDENACTDCAIRESPLVRQFCDCQPKCNICKDKNKCVEACNYSKPNYVNSFLEKPSYPSPDTKDTKIQRQEPPCREINPISCKCKKEYVEKCVDCKRCRCNCDKRCPKYICKSRISEGIDNNNNKSVTETVEITNVTKDESLRSPRKSAKQVENISVKSPRNLSEIKSPRKTSTPWRKPNKLTVQRFEVFEITPNEEHIEEIKEKEVEEETPLEMQEHYRNLKAVESESSTKSINKFANSTKDANSGKLMNSTDQTLCKKKIIANGANAKNPKFKPKELHRYPWNFNNQPKTQTPMKNSTACKQSRYPKFSGNMKIGVNNFTRSRAGEDFGNSMQKSEPEYFEYRRNLVSNSLEHTNKTEENIKVMEQRKYKKGLGKMRIQLWHEKLEKYAEKTQERTNAEHELEKVEENKNSKNNKANDIFSDDDSDNGKPKKLSENLNSTAKARSDKGCKGETHNQGSSFGKVNHERKYLQVEIPAENRKQEQSKTSGPGRDHPDMNLIQDVTTGEQLENKSKHIDSRHLSTIFEENSERSHCVHGKQSKRLNDTNCLPKTEKCTNCSSSPPRSRPRSAYVLKSSNQETHENSRPRSADAYSEESMQTPYFNVIRQKIHSRTEKTLEDLEKFRDEHFFETHDTTSYHQDLPEHTCVHRFTVDNRLYPQPVHSNSLGVSCCIHCNQPMKNEKSVFSDQRQLGEKFRKTRNGQKHLSKFFSRPKPVHIGSRNSVMEIKLGPEHVDLLQSEKIIQPKSTFYRNSLALRHQRR